MKTLILVLVFSATYQVLHASTYAQEYPLKISESQSANCEATYAYFAGIAADLKDNDEVLVVSFRGREETLADVADERLYNAYTVLKKLIEIKELSRKNVSVLPVLAPQFSNKGKIEIYVNGKKQVFIDFIKNRRLRVGPCVTETGDECKDAFFKDFIPCRKYTPSIWNSGTK